ncbi:MAG: baseplate J/gp47 family protein [Alistipes sp.]|nr:baseplate J/gp47 family protein [Alistipes sp.]
MFDEYSYELLLQDVLDNAPAGIDTRPGSIFYDAVSGILIKVAKLYSDLDLVFTLTQLDTASGEYLDIKSSEYGIVRHAATKAQYSVIFEGSVPNVGERFFTNGEYFTLKETDDGVMYLEAETSGTDGNNIYSSTPAVPVNNIQGLVSATFGTIVEYGADDETDESLRQRLREKIASPTENGNKQHYKTWCESFEGVGRARIIPLWNGPNTVKAILINPLGLPCSDSVVESLQEYIDPATKGYTAVVDGKTYVVGDGLGEGISNLGAHFTAAAAGETRIDISFDAELTSGTTADSAIGETTEAVRNYFKNLVIGTSDTNDILIRLSAIGALISGLPTILDYSELKINGDTKNIYPGEDNVPIVGEVTINVLQ